MKKLISAFLILTVLLVCLAGAAMAAAPTIGEMTVSDEGFVTLAVTGENINYIGVTFYGEDGNWAGMADLNLNEETGLYEGTNYYYDPETPYATAEYTVSAEQESSYESETKKSENKGKQYTYDRDRKLTGWEEYDNSTARIYSDDEQTLTRVSDSSTVQYDAAGKTIAEDSTHEETVGSKLEWQVEGYENKCSDYATKTAKKETTRTEYSASGESFTRETVENFKVKLIDETPDDTWIPEFYADSYSFTGYEIISGEKTVTEKGVSESEDYDGINLKRTEDLKTIYSVTANEDPDNPGYMTRVEEETGKTGTQTDVRKGSTEYGDGTKEVDEKTTYTYHDDHTLTMEKTLTNKYYDQDGQLTRVQKRDYTDETKYTSYVYRGEYSDGTEYETNVSGYATTAYRGTHIDENYEGGNISDRSETEYDLQVQLKANNYYVPLYTPGRSDYVTLGGTQKEKSQRDEEYGNSPSRTESTSESETVFQDAKNKVVHEVQTDRDVIKATGAVRSEDVRDSTTHYEFSAYTVKFSSQEQDQEGWHAAAEESKRTQKVYDPDTGVLTGDNESTSKTEYDFVKYTYGENNEYYDYQSRIATDTTDYVNRGFSSDTGLRTYVETGYSRKKVTGDTLEEKFGDEQLDYDSSTGSYTGKSVTETVRTQKKGEGGSNASPFSWPVETSNTVMKQYNAKDALIYEMNEVMANGVTKENRTNYTNKGKVSSTYIKEEDNNKGTRYIDRKYYNTYTGAVQSETRRDATKGEDGRWQETSSYTYNNDDGSLRSGMVRHPDGSEEHYNNANSLVATKDKDGTWKDGSGNVLGKNETDENGNYSNTYVYFKSRTGEIQSYHTTERTDKEYVSAEYRGGKKVSEERTVYKEDGSTERYYDGALRSVETKDKRTYYDKQGNVDYSVEHLEDGWYTYNAKGVKTRVSYDKGGYAEFDAEGNIIYEYKPTENGAEYYGENAKLLYSVAFENNETDGVRYTVYKDGSGKEFARLYDKEEQKEEANGDSHTTYESVAIAGEPRYDDIVDYEWWEPETASGTLEKTVGTRDVSNTADPVTGERINRETETQNFTKWNVQNGVKTGEVTRTSKTEYVSSDAGAETREYNDGVLTRVNAWTNDEYGNTVKGTGTYYDAGTGKLESGYAEYYRPDTPFKNRKDIDQYNNLQTWSNTDNTDEWNWTKKYYADGRPAGESWEDELDYDSSYSVRYYLNGNKATEESTLRNGNSESSSSVEYREDGTIEYKSETRDGVTDSAWYEEDGSLGGWTWHETYDDATETTSYEIWDADSLLYSYVGTYQDGSYRVTYSDPAGNKLTTYRGKPELTLAEPGDGWKYAVNNWFYVQNGEPVRDGWQLIDGAWYYFDRYGRMNTTLVAGDTTYAMTTSGALSTGGWTHNDSGWEYTDENGVVKTGWQLIDGVWYYFDDGWDYVEKDYKDESYWEQSGHKGVMQTGAVQIWNSDWATKHTYFFNKDGSWDTSTGWKVTNGVDLPVEYHYYNANGQEVTGWQLIDGKWYYFNEDGVMKNGWVGSGPAWYYMDPVSGTISTGWVQEKFEDDWYYMGEDGVMKTGWINDGGTWFYMKNDGVMAKNEFVQSGSSWFYMGSNGAMATGWVLDNGSWYYLDGSGVMQTGWQQIDGSWYYLGTDGAMRTGWQQIVGGVWFYFGSNGVMRTGWQQIDGSWFYFAGSGAMMTGWQQIGGTWYYFEGNGVMIAGTTVTIGGVEYVFDASGAWVQ